MLKTSCDLTTLDQFLSLPGFKPAFEFIGGRVIQKMPPQLPHSIIQVEFVASLNSYARPRKLGRAYTELRSVFGGAAHVPDVSFFVQERVPKFVRGQEAPLVAIPPDVVAEILSPGQAILELSRKIRHSLKHGSRLGWLIDTAREELRVLRPGLKAETLDGSGVLGGEGVLPGFALPVDEIFGWLDQG